MSFPPRLREVQGGWLFLKCVGTDDKTLFFARSPGDFSGSLYRDKLGRSSDGGKKKKESKALRTPTHASGCLVGQNRFGRHRSRTAQKGRLQAQSILPTDLSGRGDTNSQ